MTALSSSSPHCATPRAARRATHPVARRAALVAAGAAVTLALGSCGVDDDTTTPGADTDHGATTAPQHGSAAGPHTGTDTDATPASAAGHRFARYVALGDSFAAFGPVDAPTTGPAPCPRSTRNYPAQLARSADIGELVDVTCGGARTPDMSAPQIGETPPQFTALTADTDLVTLSIGGNDIGFGDIAGCVLTGGASSGAPCRDLLEGPVTAALDALAAKLDAVYAGIRERSPDARVVTTAYLPLVPAHGGCEFVSAMAPGDVTWTRYVTHRINLLVPEAAGRAGADLVSPPDAAAHHACAPAGLRYTDFTGTETASHPMHPTEAGQAAMARAIAAAL